MIWINNDGKSTRTKSLTSWAESENSLRSEDFDVLTPKALRKNKKF